MYGVSNKHTHSYKSLYRSHTLVDFQPSHRRQHKRDPLPHTRPSVVGFAITAAQTPEEHDGVCDVVGVNQAPRTVKTAIRASHIRTPPPPQQCRTIYKAKSGRHTNTSNVKSVCTTDDKTLRPVDVIQPPPTPGESTIT